MEDYFTGLTNRLGTGLTTMAEIRQEFERLHRQIVAQLFPLMQRARIDYPVADCGDYTLQAVETWQ